VEAISIAILPVGLFNWRSWPCVRRFRRGIYRQVEPLAGAAQSGRYWPRISTNNSNGSLHSSNALGGREWPCLTLRLDSGASTLPN